MKNIEVSAPVDLNAAVNRERLVGSAMFSPEAWALIARSLGLSGRELQIVRGAFDDKTESEMAADLHISPSTIHTHVERLHHKLAITDRTQLLLRVMQEFIALTATPGSDLPPICAVRAARNCPLYP
jgi:DNA-binding NarL/FixJ family response regulator